MAQQSQDKLNIDGSSFADLEISDVGPNRNSLWAFLTQIVPCHPWISGLAAIVGIVAFGGDRSPWVLIVAIVGVTLITVASAWKRSSYERTKTADESYHVKADAR